MDFLSSPWLRGLGLLGQIVGVIVQLDAAEEAGEGTVTLPTIQIHSHKKTWQVPLGPATLTTQHPKPPPLPSPPA
jgi:hypothetical protein